MAIRLAARWYNNDVFGKIKRLISNNPNSKAQKMELSTIIGARKRLPRFHAMK